MSRRATRRVVEVPCGTVRLPGMLEVPADVEGLVIFAEASGSSRHAPRNRAVANVLREARLATLLMDLLTAGEDRHYETRFDIGLLTTRLSAAVKWAGLQTASARLGIGLFGAGTGAGAALHVAAALRSQIGAVVCRSGRPDLASRSALGLVKAPTLLVVSGEDHELVGPNERAFTSLRGEKELEIVPGAARDFESPAALDRMAGLTAGWFARHLARRADGRAR